MKIEPQKAKAMASNNNGKEKKEVMQSNLPLLFANGSPVSLESMNLNELQRFFLFLLKCECGRPISSLSDLEPPTWWPSEVAFGDELMEKTSKKGMWSSVMRKLIQKCYDHHSSGFLLEFSRKLMIATQDSGKIKVLDNGDGTKSMRSASTDKLLVTFRSENQDYDIKQRQQLNSFSTSSPLKKRCSLSLGINASDPRLPRCEDLYLCDNCGDSFQSLQQVLVHEKKCLQPPDCQPGDESQQRFFAYFKLKPSTSKETPGRLNASPGTSSKVVRPRPGTYAKFLSIDVTSPLGQYIYSLSSNTKDAIDINSLCSAERKSALRGLTSTDNSINSYRVKTKNSNKKSFYPTLVKGGHGKEFPVTYRGNRMRKACRQDPHLYCFTKRQRAVRRFTLKNGLSPRSMSLFETLNKRSLRVTLTRLNLTRAVDRVKSIEEEKRRQAKLRFLKEQARHFEPYVPKITSAYHLSKQTNVSVLQSFTSAVQQLCSPEKVSSSSPKAVAPKKGSSSSSSGPKSGKNPQCIDLISSDEDID